MAVIKLLGAGTTTPVELVIVLYCSGLTVPDGVTVRIIPIINAIVSDILLHTTAGALPTRISYQAMFLEVIHFPSSKCFLAA